MFIVNPLSGQRMDNLFSTHPAVENRIAALMAMEAEGGFRPAPAPGFAPASGARPPVAVPRVGTSRMRGPWG